MGHIGTALVGFIHGPAHPLFIPPDLVHPVVVTAAIRGGGPVEIPVINQGPHRILATG